MNLKELNEIDQLDEEIFNRYNISQKAGKLIKKLETKNAEIQNKLEDPRFKNMPVDKQRELKEKAFAIKKTTPVIKKFERYFLRLEKSMEGMSDEKRKKKIQSKYNEIKHLFIEELYTTMRLVGYNASLILASIIATLIVTVIATIPLPGTTFALAIPSVLLIKKLQSHKKRVHSKQFEKEIDELIKKLEKKKRKNLRSF